MKNYQYLLLDLDGTIIDPWIGITRSAEYALNYFNIEVTDLKDLCRFIGPPLADSFKEFYHFTDKQAQEATLKYRERFAEIGIMENELYNGIRVFLSKARQKGFTLMLATSKPVVFAKQILDKYELSNEFTFIGGNDLNDSRKHKADVIKYVLESNNILDLSKVIMIGDRKI